MKLRNYIHWFLEIHRLLNKDYLLLLLIFIYTYLKGIDLYQSIIKFMIIHLNIIQLCLIIFKLLLKKKQKNLIFLFLN